MVQSDLAAILAVNPVSMSSRDREDLFDTLIDYEIEEDLDPDKMRTLFDYTQQILRYKGEQVESLLTDLDNLGASVDGSDELREELVRTKKQNEQLVEELENKERLVEANNEIIEKLKENLSELERERRDLREEITLVRRERLDAAGQDDSDMAGQTLEQLRDTIQVKNKHILQLLTDLEVTEKDNEKLRTKESRLRRELTEATAQTTKLSGENISLREDSYNNQEKISLLEERNTALVSQVSDLVRERNTQDSKLDQLIDALEARVSKWQEILSHKDNELADLQARLEELQSCSQSQQHANYSILTQSLSAHEDKIRQLEDQLSHATHDLQESTVLLQEFKKKAESRDGSEVSEGRLELLREELEKSQSHVLLLEERLKDAEQDAQQRAEEMTEMIIQLREYEEGRYGLKEAREELIDLKKQIALRDKQIEKLVQQANQLHIQLGDKVSLTPGEMYSGDETTETDEDTGQDSQALRNQLHQMQQTAINLSIQNYDLKAQVIKLSEEVEKTKSEVSKVDKIEEFIQTDFDERTDDEKPLEEVVEHQKVQEEKLKELIQENESLRQGLHEILESIHNQDGTSTVSIESECLESLLEALDSRSVSGWYHPAMRLQATLNKLQGTNQALRQQIREARIRESFFQGELQAALIKIEDLETNSAMPDAHELESEVGDRNVIEEQGQMAPPIPPPRRLKSVEEAKESEGDEDDPAEEEEVSPKRKSSSKSGSLSPWSSEEGMPLKEKSSSNNQMNEMKENHNGRHNGNSGDPGPGDANGKSGDEVNEAIIEDGNGKASPGERLVTELEVVDAITQTDFPEDNEPAANQDLISSHSNDQNNRLKMDSSVGTNGIVFANGDTLREKCEALKFELQLIKDSTEDSLKEMNSIRDQICQEIRDVIKKVEDKMSSRPTSPQDSVDQELNKLKDEVNDLKEKISVKEGEVKSREAQLAEMRALIEEQRTGPSVDDAHLTALKTTVTSLQNLINKKEEVIDRYQELLQDNSEEYNKLMDQYKALEAHTKRLPSPKKDSQSKLTDSRAVTLLMEKWLGRVHALEEQVCTLAHQLSESNHEVETIAMECHRWKAIAQRVDEKQSEELQDVLEERKKEIEDLRTAIDQIKLDCEMKTKERLRIEALKFRKREDEYKVKIRGYESEVARLKQNSRNTTYKPPVSSKKEYMLLDKIKNLEEELQQFRQKEQCNLQLRRDRCAEEVSKWEEKKRLQTTNEKLKTELRDKINQVESFEVQTGRLKMIISRMERERIALQRRLKASQENVSNLVLNQRSRPTSKCDGADDAVKNLYDSGLEASPLGNTPRSRTSSVGSMTNDESKPKGRSRQDLERAVIALKKVIQKLRSENSSRLFNKDYVEKLQKELKKTQESYMDQIDRVAVLEAKLKAAEADIAHLRRKTFTVESGDEAREIFLLREQLNQKCDLLSKVKVLLQRAMLREKHLMDQIAALQNYVPPERLETLEEDS